MRKQKDIEDVIKMVNNYRSHDTLWKRINNKLNIQNPPSETNKEDL